MTEGLLSLGNTTLILLALALIIFSWLAAQSRNFRRFQFQISVFVVIWIIGEIIDLLEENNIIETGIEELGMQIHLVSMVYLSCMLWLRYYFSKKGGKKMIESSEGYDN